MLAWKNKYTFTKTERERDQENIYPVALKENIPGMHHEGGDTWPTQSTTGRINFKSSRPEEAEETQGYCAGSHMHSCSV